MHQKPAHVILRLSNLSRTGQSDGVTLDLRAGEIVTLIGADGAALLDCIAGFQRPQSGTIALAGLVLNRTPPHRRQIGFAGTPAQLFPHLNVAAHARFGRDVTQARAEEVMQMLALLPFAHHLPTQLDNEHRLRTALARALAPASRLLLLQDALAGQSEAAQITLKNLLRQIARSTGLAILHITPAPALGFGLSDRIGVLIDGHLRQIDTQDAIYDRPETLEVAEALGPINRLRGHLLDTEDDTARIRLTSGTIVEAQLAPSTATLQPGAPCIVAIRPERIAVAAVAAEEMGEGALPAQLEETQFLRDHTALRFTIGPAANADIWVTRPAGVIPPRGTRISLAWQTHHAHVFTEPLA